MSNAFTADRERNVKTSIRKANYSCRVCGETVLGRLCVMVSAFIYEHVDCYKKRRDGGLQ